MAKKFLIADDSLMARLQVRRYLETIGFTEASYQFAGDGSQALEMLEQHGADVLITDLNMPAMNGLELIRAVTDGHVPPPGTIIVLTAAVGPALTEELARYGVGAVIAKPLTLQTIAAACNDLGLRPDPPANA
jgi:CheY-like chemotaxis protein